MAIGPYKIMELIIPEVMVRIVKNKKRPAIENIIDKTLLKGMSPTIALTILNVSQITK